MLPLPESQSLLFVSILLDPPGSRVARQLGKIQVSSLLRSIFDGEITVWRNFPEVLYPVPRADVHEFDFRPSAPLTNDDGLALAMSQAKRELSHSLTAHQSRYRWIIFADPQVLALRNWDHLFDWPTHDAPDLLVSRRPDGQVDDGFFAISAPQFERFVTAWANSQSLSEIIASEEFSHRIFERGEVVYPFFEGCSLRDLLEGAVVNLVGGKPSEQTKIAFALHMMRTFGDKEGIFLDLIES